MALKPLLDALFIDQPADPIPGERAQHGADQSSQHHRNEAELPLLHIKTPQRHDQL